ncbi:DNA-binding protein [Microbispora bryophytorum]|uniref:DNA-binding protein n=1 Tax=Microbispora bryophytorum TaxID=1460882 RepID=UPI0033E354F9
MKKQMSIEEALALPVSTDLETAGRAHGFGLTKTRELVRRGEFPCPVLRLGNQYRVTRADLLRSLGIDPLLTLDGNAAREDSNTAA